MFYLGQSGTLCSSIQGEEAIDGHLSKIQTDERRERLGKGNIKSFHLYSLRTENQEQFNTYNKLLKIVVI